MRPWCLGNTTVRSPFRLRDGLVALSLSSLQGNLRGQEQEIAFRRLLGDHGIVELGTDETYSVGRKWCSALNKLGFLYPEIPPAAGIPQGEIGLIDMITKWLAADPCRHRACHAGVLFAFVGRTLHPFAVGAKIQLPGFLTTSAHTGYHAGAGDRDRGKSHQLHRNGARHTTDQQRRHHWQHCFTGAGITGTTNGGAK